MIELVRESSALLVIDMQNGFCDERGSIARIGFDTAMLQAAVEPCTRLVSAARQARVPVLYTAYVYQPGHSDGGVLVEHLMPELRTSEALIAGTWDAAIVDVLAPAAGETVITKNRPSAFFRTKLAAHLERHGVYRLLVCGVNTNCCVESTVRDASQFDLQAFVVGDATGELDAVRHTAALATMGLLFGRVVSVADVEAALA